MSQSKAVKRLFVPDIKYVFIVCDDNVSQRVCQEEFAILSDKFVHKSFATFDASERLTSALIDIARSDSGSVLDDQCMADDRVYAAFKRMQVLWKHYASEFTTDMVVLVKVDPMCDELLLRLLVESTEDMVMCFGINMSAMKAPGERLTAWETWSKQIENATMFEYDMVMPWLFHFSTDVEFEELQDKLQSIWDDL